MALTDIDKVKLEIGLNYLEDWVILTDEEVNYFLDKNNASIRRASLDAAKTVLFIVSQYVHSKTGVELEIWGAEFFKNYMTSLKMYINDPNFSIATQGANPFAGGISKQDIQDTIADTDNNVSKVESPIPTDGFAVILKNDPFDQSIYNINDPFNI